MSNRYNDDHWARLSNAWAIMVRGGKGCPYLPQEERLFAWHNHTLWARHLVRTKYKSRGKRSPDTYHDKVLPDYEGGWGYQPSNMRTLHEVRVHEVLRVLYTGWDPDKNTLRQVHRLVGMRFWVHMALLDMKEAGLACPQWPSRAGLRFGQRVIDYRVTRDQVIAQHGHFTLALMEQYHQEQAVPHESRYRNRTNRTEFWELMKYVHND